MKVFFQIIRNFFILIFILSLIGLYILYIHNILFELNFEIFFLLIKNHINVFHLHYNCDEFCSGYISPADFHLLILELKGELN